MSAIFLPIVKKDKVEKFKVEWKNWLCLSDEIEQEKKPGLLKVEFLTLNGQMISLCPKSYRAHCRDRDSSKIGKKGIPMWFDIHLQEYFDILYNDNAEPSVAEVCSLRLDKDKIMARTRTRKVGLTGIHAKRGVQDDRITTEPLSVDGKFI